MTVIDMGKRSCRHCGRPTGSLTRTCSDLRCVLKQTRGKMNHEVALAITRAHAHKIEDVKKSIHARGDHIVYEDHEMIVSTDEIPEPIEELIARSSLGDVAPSRPSNPHVPIHGDLPHVIKRRGWCPGCKEKLEECTCSGDEPGSIFDR